MGEIKFDAGRMKQILIDLEKISEQLGMNCDDAFWLLRSIYENISGDKAVVVLARYAEVITEEVAKATVELKKLTSYLETQIANYVTAEQEAVDSLETVRNMLNTLEEI